MTLDGFIFRCDIEGGVSYRELLSFCARYAGKWGRFREALRIQVKSNSPLKAYT